MSEEIKIHKSTKVEPEEAAKIDPKDIGKTTTPGPVSAEVEGQWHVDYVWCGCCGGLNRFWVSDTHYRYYNCAWCGCLFRL